MIVAKQLVVTVAASGTRVPLFDSAVVQPGSVVAFTISPHTVTTAVYVGDSSVSATAYGAKLSSTSPSFTMNGHGNAISTSSVYIGAATSGDKVAVLYFEKVSS